MKESLEVVLACTLENAEKLEALQKLFTSVCIEISNHAAEFDCWSRVGLHHLTYHEIRKKYPSLGSQMTCNAIYSVSRLAKENLTLNKKNKFNKKFEIIDEKKIPIFFDKHTVSIKNNLLSMFTMEGRIKFKINTDNEIEEKIKNNKLKEIILITKEDKYILKFEFN